MPVGSLDCSLWLLGSSTLRFHCQVAAVGLQILSLWTTHGFLCVLPPGALTFVTSRGQHGCNLSCSQLRWSRIACHWQTWRGVGRFHPSPGDSSDQPVHALQWCASWTCGLNWWTRNVAFAARGAPLMSQCWVKGVLWSWLRLTQGSSSTILFCCLEQYADWWCSQALVTTLHEQRDSSDDDLSCLGDCSCFGCLLWQGWSSLEVCWCWGCLLEIQPCEVQLPCEACLQGPIFPGLGAVVWMVWTLWLCILGTMRLALLCRACSWTTMMCWHHLACPLNGWWMGCAAVPIHQWLMLWWFCHMQPVLLLPLPVMLVDGWSPFGWLESNWLMHQSQVHPEWCIALQLCWLDSIQIWLAWLISLGRLCWSLRWKLVFQLTCLTGLNLIIRQLKWCVVETLGKFAAMHFWAFHSSETLTSDTLQTCTNFRPFFELGLQGMFIECIWVNSHAICERMWLLQAVDLLCKTGGRFFICFSNWW